MIPRLAAVTLCLALAYLVVGLWLPSERHIERSILIDRPPAAVFTLLNGFRHFPAWFPWADRDPDAEYTTTGPLLGPGAGVSWRGQARQVGSGSLEITGGEAPRWIDMQARIDGTGAGHLRFTIVPVGESSRLNWRVETHVSRGRGFFGGLLARHLGLFLEPWLGPDLEDGLHRLQVLAESLPAEPFTPGELEFVCLGPETLLATEVRTGDGVTRAFGRLALALGPAGRALSGPPLVMTRTGSGAVHRRLAAVAVPAGMATLDGDVMEMPAPAGPALRLVPRGPGSAVAGRYASALAFLATAGLEPGTVSWERYVTDPADDTVPPLTEVYLMLAEPASRLPIRSDGSSRRAEPAFPGCPPATAGSAGD